MIFIIVILGFALRLINLNQSLWLDEAISALAARDFSYWGITFDFLRIDNHPPFFYLLLKLWGQIFGFTDWILRIFPAVLGVVVVYAVYKVTEKISGNSKMAIIAGIFTSTSPLLVYYSQEIRMYILITLLATVQVYVFINLLNREKLWKWAVFAFINCLLFFSDYITVFLFPIFLLYPLLKKDSKLLLKVLLSFIPLVILFTFWFPMFNEQLIKNKEIVNSFPGWQFIVGGATFKNLVVTWMKFVLGRISFEPKIIYYSLVAIGSIPVILSLYLSFIAFRKNLLLWLWFIMPISLGFLFSFIIPVFNYFRFIYVLPALLILCIIGIFKLRGKLRYVLMGSIIFTHLIGLSIYYLDPTQQRENWRQAIEFIENNSTQEDLVIFEFHELIAPYNWYSTGKIDAIGATDSYYANKEKTYQKMESELIGKKRTYHFEYLRDLTDPNKIVENKLVEEDFKKTTIYNNFYNIGQISVWAK